MIVLLISGMPNTGKSELFAKIEILLNAMGYSEVANSRIQNGKQNKDFNVIFSGKDKKNNNRRIILNYASDNTTIISDFDTYLQNNRPDDIVISAISDTGQLRTDMCTILQKYSPSEIIEIPLAKIARRNNWIQAKNEYQDRFELLIKHILLLKPFYL